MHLKLMLHAVNMTIISVILTHQMVLSWQPIRNKFPGPKISNGLWRSSVQNHKSEAHYMEAYGKFDICALYPCKNAGQCLTVQDRFLCRCPPGWSGKVCQQSDDIQSVHSIAKRTARAGTCTVDPVDVVFVLDSTGSIGSAGFQNELDFVKGFTNLVIIGRDAFHIGVVQFGDNTLGATLEFDLKLYSDKSSIISAVQGIRYQFGSIDYIDVGLQLAKDVLDRTARSNAVIYVVLLTDGGSRNETATLAIARTLKSLYPSLRLYVIGIGLGAPTVHLQQVASDTSYFLHVDEPAKLAAIVNSAVSKTCQDIKDCASSPCQNGATCVTTASGYTCTCLRGFDGVRCQTVINECGRLPCLNGGSCTNTIDSYMCNCTDGWTGRKCSDDVNECHGLPCINGGNCTNTNGSYICNCLKGFKGKNCGEDIDECTFHPCENGGNCTNGDGSYSCNCPHAWTGKNCSNDVNECDIFPCKNGGNCTNMNGSYVCLCPEGINGKNCTEDINECEFYPCENGGNCTNVYGTYVCYCALGWTGKNCSDDINECEYTPCQHGDCTNTDGSYSCDCQNGWSGKNCSDVQLELILPLIMLPLALLALVITLLVKITMRRTNNVSDSTTTLSRETPLEFNVEGWKHGSLGVSRPSPPVTSFIFNKSLPPEHQ